MKRGLVFALACVTVAALTTGVNAQLNMFYDVRGNIADIDAGNPPIFANTASLAGYFPYQGYEMAVQNGGMRGDGEMVFLSPKIHDVTDYTGIGPPDGVDEHIDLFYGGDFSVATIYLYAEFVGTAGEVVSSIGVDQDIDAAAFADDGSHYYLLGATTTIQNTGLWDGHLPDPSGSGASVPIKLVQVPVTDPGGGPVFDATAGIGPGTTHQIAQLDLEGEYRPGSATGTPQSYDLFLGVNNLLCTRVSDPGPAPLLNVNFGYDGAGSPEAGGSGEDEATTSPTTDVVIRVQTKGDYDSDGRVTSIDDFAYYDMSGNWNGDPVNTNMNRYELYLSDFDLDGSPATALDDFQYYQYANLP